MTWFRKRKAETAETEARVLERYRRLEAIPDAVRGELFSASRKMRVDAGMHVQMEGSRCSLLAFVVSGHKRVYKLSEQGREITLYEVGPGELCPLMILSVVTDRDYLANAVALSSLELIGIPAPRVRSALVRHDAVRSFLFRHLHGEIASFMALFSEVAFDRTHERLLRYLARKAEQGKVVATHQEIASDLGTMREVVSRLLKQFERRGLVRLSRGVIRLTEKFEMPPDFEGGSR